jgi:hypothetical protein
LAASLPFMALANENSAREVEALLFGYRRAVANGHH